MKIIREHIGFKRGQSPKEALNIGLKAKISSWLDGMQVRNYTINDNLTIDVDGNVYLVKKLDGNLPSFIKFRKVDGYFSCDNNNLTSLEGAPQSVGLHFYCEHNNLTSLKGAPQSVGGAFYCRYNKVQFTEDDIKKVSNVKGAIFI